MSSRRGVDFNHILGFLNIVIATVTVVAYSRVGGNEYLSGDSVLLSTLLAVQTQLALFIERRRRDPFVIVVAFILVLYYLLRVLTLLLVPFSFVLDRFPYVAADSTNALLFMLIANTFLYAGFLSRSVAQEPPARDEAPRARHVVTGLHRAPRSRRLARAPGDAAPHVQHRRPGISARH